MQRYLHGTSKKAEAKKEAQEHKKKAKRQKVIFKNDAVIKFNFP